MSIINKMLQELDKRHALSEPRSPTAPAYAGLTQQARPVEDSATLSTMFWRILAGIIVVVLAWVIWVLWQIVPRPVVTDQAYQSLSQSRPSIQAPPAVAPGAAAPAGRAEPAAPPAKTETAPAAVRSETVDMLRLATEIVTPIRSAVPGSPPPARQGERDMMAEAKPPARARAEPARPAPRTAASDQRAVAGPSEAGRIDKRVDATPREGAEAEFRRAMVLVNQGRMAEGMDGLRAALSLDAGYETARQTLVALLLESKRTDEAAGLLQQGLALNPANLGYAMPLARIYVENGDPQRALALLQKSEAAGRTSAEYHAFVAALYQRLGRHAEAVDKYQGALRLSAGVGAWWVGLGISQEALERRHDAAESFSRAKAAGNLNGELLAYVDRRLKQLP